MRTYVHTYTHTYIHTDRQTDIHTYIIVNVNTYVYIYTCVCLNAVISIVIIFIAIIITMSIYIYTYIFAYLHIYLLIYLYCRALFLHFRNLGLHSSLEVGRWLLSQVFVQQNPGCVDDILLFRWSRLIQACYTLGLSKAFVNIGVAMTITVHCHMLGPSLF